MKCFEMGLILRDVKASRSIVDAYHIHQKVSNLLDGNEGRKYVYRWSLLPSGILVRARFACESDMPEEARDHVAVHMPIEKGRVFRFAVDAIPTVKETTSGRSRQIVGRDACLEWLNKKLSERGADILAADETDVFSVRIGKSGCDFSRRVSRFAGTLRVDDPDLLGKAFLCGIGKGRAFGFGMLNLEVGNEGSF